MPKLSLAKSRQKGVAWAILVQNGADILTLTVILTTSALYKRVRLWLPHRLLKHQLLSPTILSRTTTTQAVTFNPLKYKFVLFKSYRVLLLV